MSACLGDEEAFALAAAGDLARRAPQAMLHLEECDDCRQLISALVNLREVEAGRGQRLVEGRRIGRYVLRRAIGEGGMSVVWEAEDLHLGRRVALKWLHPAMSADPETDYGRILHEARAAARLNHPNVVTVFDSGTDDGEAFIALELAEGGTLAQWLRARPRTTAEIVGAFTQAGRGLAAGHATGIVHGDFKPDNVLRSIDEDEAVFKVTDFGLATGVGDFGSRAGSIAGRGSCSLAGGTPFFLAPERIGGGPPTARSDQYSFGIALAAALGALRGPGDVAPHVRRVPRALLDALDRATARDPAERFATMEELLAALDRAMRAQRKRRAILRVVALASALCVAGGVTGAIASRLGVERFAYATTLRNPGMEAGMEHPDHWKMSGGGQEAFDLVRTETVVHSGRASAQMRPRHPAGTRSPGYGTAMQVVNARDFRGRRVRASVWVRTEGATERAEFWIRARFTSGAVDGPELGANAAMLATDSDWRRYEIELDVPPRTRVLDFGVGIDGPGTLWFDDASVEVIPNSEIDRRSVDFVQREGR